MSLKKTLMTWFTVAMVGVMPVVGGVGCGWHDLQCAIAALFAALYSFLTFDVSECDYYDEAVARHSNAATLDMPGVLSDRLSLQVDRRTSLGRFQEADGFTAIGLNDPTNKVTVEIVLPGQQGGEWKVSPAQEGVAPHFRVKVGDKEYRSVGLQEGQLQLALQNPYPEKGQQYVGKVVGSVFAPDGTTQPVSFEFSVTRF
jgi:hypothetical protein